MVILGLLNFLWLEIGHKRYNLLATHTLIYNCIPEMPNFQLQWLMQMDFNVGKCNIMQFSNARYKRSFTYTIQGLPLCIVDHHSYLGVVLDHKLSWEAHQNYVSNKVNWLLAFLIRKLPKHNQHLQEYSYKRLIIPVLDYCAIIWDPYYHNAVLKCCKTVLHALC